MPVKIESIAVWGEERVEKLEEGRRGRVEENLREWDSTNGGRTEMRAREKISWLTKPL